MVGVNDGRELWEKMMDADAGSTRIERIGGTPIWEFFPSPFHQDVLRTVDRSVRPMDENGACACYTLSDAYLRLPDGSLRRPDLMVYCNKPEIVRREPLAEVPGAVVEILSPGGEMKDLQLGPPSYLANGVLDVIVIDPESSVCTHFRRDGSRTLRRGETIRLEMGCVVTV